MSDPISVLLLPDGDLRQFPPNADADDLGVMYVLDVLGVTLLVRERDGDVYVHVDTADSTSVRPGGKPVTYEINNSGENPLG